MGKQAKPQEKKETTSKPKRVRVPKQERRKVRLKRVLMHKEGDQVMVVCKQGDSEVVLHLECPYTIGAVKRCLWRRGYFVKAKHIWTPAKIAAKKLKGLKNQEKAELKRQEEEAEVAKGGE